MIVSTKSANSKAPSSSGSQSPRHKPATLTHSCTTDTLVLYEPCVRPSVLGRVGRSASLGSCVQSLSTNICLCTVKENKSVQTEAIEGVIYSAASAEAPQATSPAEDPQSAPARRHSPAIFTSSESRESARNPSPSPSDSTPQKLLVAKRRPRQQGEFADAAAQASGVTAGNTQPRQMPMLHWTSAVRRLRVDQCLAHQSVRHRALFVLDLDLAAVLSFIIACALFVAVTSIAQQIFWPSPAAGMSDDASYMIREDRGYFSQNVYY